MTSLAGNVAEVPTGRTLHYARDAHWAIAFRTSEVALRSRSSLSQP